MKEVNCVLSISTTFKEVHNMLKYPKSLKALGRTLQLFCQLLTPKSYAIYHFGQMVCMRSAGGKLERKHKLYLRRLMLQLVAFERSNSFIRERAFLYPLLDSIHVYTNSNGDIEEVVVDVREKNE